MKNFEIFKTGTHTAASGATLDFSEDMVKEAALAYDPALHEAPIVVGHPKDNHPAYGWVGSLSYSEGVLTAEATQLDADFSEMVSSGRFKKRSASFYLPDAPNNPKPGTLYLRHVGFLGAQPPAVKGLRDVSFGEAEQGVIEFSDENPYIWSTIATMFRGLRDWMIAEKGTDVANNILPSYYVSELEGEYQRQQQKQNSQTGLNSFTEDNNAMSAELQKLLDAANAKLAAKEAETASFSEKESAIKARELAITRKEVGSQVDALVAAGKLTPAQKPGLCEFMASLSGSDVTVEFGEGDAVKKLTPRAFMSQLLESLPKQIDFEEKSGETNLSDKDMTSEKLADKAVEFREEKAKKGVTVSVTEAIQAVLNGETA